jgi:hypothetical protein
MAEDSQVHADTQVQSGPASALDTGKTGDAEAHHNPITGLESPDTVTLRWLYDRVPAKLWLAYVGTLVLVFGVGVSAGQFKIVRDLYGKGEPSPSPQPTVIRVTPSGLLEIRTVAPDDPRGWLQKYMMLIDYEAKKLPPNLHRATGAVEHIIQNPTDKTFDWVLAVNNSNYNLDRAWGFRQTKDGLIQPLKFQTYNNEMRFAVPMCDKDDRLIAVVLVTWEKDLSLDDVASVFVSKVR